MSDESVRLPAMSCPRCRATLNAAGQVSSPDQPVPKPGDLSVCAYCAVILVFGAGFTLREMTESEFGQLEPESALQLRMVQQLAIKTTVRKRALLN